MSKVAVATPVGTSVMPATSNATPAAYFMDLAIFTDVEKNHTIGESISEI